MQKKIFNYFVALIIGLVSAFSAAEPMDDVFALLDSEGGTRSGTNSVDGYYVVALGISNRSNETKGQEEARMKALHYLSEMMIGMTVTSNNSVAMEYVTVSDEEGDKEFSSEQFISVVNTKFQGRLSNAKQIKSGKYDGKYFVAIVISETDVSNSNKLKSQTSGSQQGAGNTIIIATDGSKESIAEFKEQNTTVESKGLASMKHGEAEARQLALVDAIRSAVQQAQGVMLQGKSGRFNEAISVALSTKTEGYVSSYELLDEDIERGQYYIIIDAIVDSGKLLKDVNFYTKVLGQPVFSIQSENPRKTELITDELEKLGFTINDGNTKPTHTFYLKQSQRPVEDHKGSAGIETTLSIQLKDTGTGEILLTVDNNPLKSRIYVQPESRAQQVSELVAYKQLKKKLGIEVIRSLAKKAKQGLVYKIVIRNAKKTDVEIFKHVLNNGTEGQVETWSWDKQDKTMTLDYRFSGPLSEAMDQGLSELYRSFKISGKGRRPHMIKVGNKTAKFEIVRG